MSKSLFLSHNSKDKPFAQRLAADLRARAIKVWIDEAEMKVGDSLIGRIETAIDDVDYLAVILSEHSVKSEWVLKEVRMAMHREIAGKRVVVIPLLYRDCILPGFLRDKLYADFRREIDYVRGVNEIVKRVKYDQATDPEVSDALQMLEDVPLTRMWRTALNTNRLSSRLNTHLQEILSQMSAEEGTWQPEIAASYLLFLSELVQNGPLNKEAWNFLSSIVENNRINVWLRHTTLERILPAGRRLIEERVVELPNLYPAHQRAVESEVVAASIQSFLNTAASHLEAAASLMVLSQLWELGDRTLREHLHNAFESYLQDQGEITSHVLDSLRERLDGSQSDIDQALLNIRESWLHSGNIDSASIGKKRAYILLRKLISEKRANTDYSELINIFRQASKLEEDGDFSLYVLVMDVFNPETVKVIRQLQGDEFTYGFFTSLTVDPYIEVTISVMALTDLIAEYGTEGLFLDERLPRSLFAKKRRGQFRTSVVDALCEAESEEAHDYLNTHLLLAIHSVLEEDEIRLFMKKVGEYSKNSRRLAILEEFFLDGMSIEDLKIKLEAFEREQ